MSRFTRAAALAWIAVVAHVAAADGVTLAPHKVQLTLTTEMGLSKASEFKPVSIAPDLSYGVTSNLTLSIIHSSFGTNGFRGSAGNGLCVTGTANGCPHVYNNAGAETLYGLTRGAAAIGALAGLYSLNLDGSFADLKLGAKSRFSSGNASVLVNPSLFLGLNHRDAMVPNADQVYVPVGITYKLDPQFTVGIGSGIKGPVEHFADNFQVPLGFSAVATVDPRISIGASFTWGRLWGAKALRDAMPAVVGDDFRALQAWLVLTI